jgi:hypothetical protein
MVNATAALRKFPSLERRAVSALAADHGPAWDARLSRSRVTYELSDAACAEALAVARSIPSSTPPTEVALDGVALPRLTAELEACRSRVEHEERLILLRPACDCTLPERRLFAWIVANILGEPLVQNTEGHRIALVYARPGGGRIANGARYHQTREGGAAHNDNVSLPEPWDYLVFSCIRRAWIGGETILISGFALHDELLAAPEVLDILRRPFWWEYRGISERLFQAPIISYDTGGEPHFRYLRRYLESAHLRAAEPLTAEQVWALDALDAILDQRHLQFRTMIEEGEILVTRDSQVLHARTSFCDRVPHAPADASDAIAGPYRFFDRVWAKKRSITG